MMMSMMMRPAQTTVKKYWMRKDSNEEAVVAGRKQLMETTRTMMILTWRSLRMMGRQDVTMITTMKHHHQCRSKTVSVSLAALQTRMCTNTSVKVRKARCPASSKVSTSKVSCRITRSAV